MLLGIEEKASLMGIWSYGVPFITRALGDSYIFKPADPTIRVFNKGRSDGEDT